MVCEGILNLCGTSTKEIEERTASLYQAQIEEIKSAYDHAILENQSLSSQIDHLKQLLIQNGISF